MWIFSGFAYHVDIDVKLLEIEIIWYGTNHAVDFLPHKAEIIFSPFSLNISPHQKVFHFKVADINDICILYHVWIFCRAVLQIIYEVWFKLHVKEVLYWKLKKTNKY